MSDNTSGKESDKRDKIKKSPRRFRRHKRVYRKWKLGKLGTAALVCGMLCVIFTAGAATMQYLWFEVLKQPHSVHQVSERIAPHAYLRISMTYLPVKLEVYDGAEITVDYMGETGLTVEETSDYEWSIKQTEDFALPLFAPDMFDYGLTVRVPKQQYRDITISAGSGDVRVEGIAAHALTVTTRDGNITLIDTRANTAVTTRSGDISAVFGDDIRKIGYQLMFDSKTGRLTTDFFRKQFDGAVGDVLIAFGEQPLRFDAVTDSGDLLFQRGRE
jgi:hypothetical protein